MQDQPDGGASAKTRSGCAIFAAILASLLVAIPVVFAVRGLATTCQSPHAGPSWWVRQHCSVGLDRVLATFEICLLVIAVALLGGGVGWFVAVRRHWPRRWPTVATGALVTMSALYAFYLVLLLSALGRWSF